MEKLWLPMVLIIPFLKGLYPKQELFIFFFAAALLFLLFVIKRRTISIDSTVFILFGVQFLSGLISLGVGLNKEAAIQGIFRMLLPFFIYFFILQSGSGPGTVPYVLRIVFGSGTLISMINFVVEALSNKTHGWVPFAWAIPYANTLAVYLFGALIAGLFIYGKEELNPTRRICIGAGICINAIALVCTESRTMWAVAAVLCFLFVMGRESRERRMDAAVIFFISLLCAVLYFATGWKLFPLVWLAAFSLVWFYEKKRASFADVLHPLLQVVSKNRKVLWLAASAALAILAVLLHFTGCLHRAVTVIATDQSLQERFAYYRDAVPILRDYPVWGVGPGGWSSIQFQYQTAVYFPEYIHSSIFQAAMDYGLTGLLLFTLQIVVFARSAWQGLKDKKAAGRELILCLTVVNLAILLHSVLDLDFQFPLISILFWANVAVIRMSSGKSPVGVKQSLAARAGFVSFAGILVLSSAVLYFSNAFYLKGEADFQKGNYSRARENLKKALVLNPVSSSSYFMLGNVQREAGLMLKVEDYWNKAEKYDTFNPRYARAKAEVLEQSGDLGASIAEYRRLLIFQPLNVENYEKLAGALREKAEGDFDAGQGEKAEENFLEVLELKDKLRQAAGKISPVAMKLKHKPALTLSPKLAYNMGIACFYLSRREEGERYLKDAARDESLLPFIRELQQRFEK